MKNKNWCGKGVATRDKHEILKKPFLAELENEKTNTSKSKKGQIREYIYQHASRAGK